MNSVFWENSIRRSDLASFNFHSGNVYLDLKKNYRASKNSCDYALLIFNTIK